MTHGRYDAFASEFFSPIYPSYAFNIVSRTGVRGGRILDLGSGGGHLGFAIMDMGQFESVTFFDKDPSQLERARVRAEALMYPEGSCFYEEGDACDLSRFQSNTFDLVVSRGSMQFWNDKKMALREIYRVLRPGGYGYIGGGVGITHDQTSRINSIMSRHAQSRGIGYDPSDEKLASESRKNRRTQQCGEFAELFHELDCSYALINSKSEGGWYIFCKDIDRDSW